MNKLKSIDLFTGIGGLSLALQSSCKPLIYCEINNYCQNVLQKNMNKNILHSAIIINDIKNVNHIKNANTICAGIPCVGFSSLGKKLGFKDSQSSLFYEMLRIIDNNEISYLFIENVANLKNDVIFFEELAKRNFKLEWIILDANKYCGANHHRKRFYCLGFKDEKPTFYKDHSLLEYKWDNDSIERTIPPITNKVERLIWKEQLKALGNAVIPQAGHLAFFTLCHGTNNKQYVNQVPSIGGYCLKEKRFYSLEHNLPIKSKDFQLTINPIAVNKNKNKSKNQRHPELTNLIQLKTWATPRSSIHYAANTVTKRTIGDLPTQLKYEINTKNKEGMCNPLFIKAMMGFNEEFII